MTNSPDALQHFIFENANNKPMPIRGNVVHLNQTFTQALQHQQLPALLKKALGELMAAGTLLTATLKMDGFMVLQLQSKGALKLLVVECGSDLKLRATAKWDADLMNENDSIIDLIKHGQFIITLEPNIGAAYQGIVPIEGETIAQILQNYMLRSQQIDTSIWLHCDGANAAGLLLQKLPHNAGEDASLDADAWNRVNMLADTVTDDELHHLATEQLLSRLFAEENVRLFDEKHTQFYCSCNKQKVGNMLRMLGADEVNGILAEQTTVDVNCDFCNKHYAFDAVDAAALFVNEPVIKPSNAKH